MELKEKSWYSWLYKSAYSTIILPQSLCNFFWRMICVIVLLPITWPIVIVGVLINNRKDPQNFGNTQLLGFYYSIFSIVFGCVTLKYLFKSTTNNFFEIYGIGIIVFPICLGILGTICYLIFRVIEHFSLLNNSKENRLIDSEVKTNWFTEGFKSFFKKYCPKITWK